MEQFTRHKSPHHFPMRFQAVTKDFSVLKHGSDGFVLISFHFLNISKFELFVNTLQQ